MSTNNIEKDNNCSFHLTEMNKDLEVITDEEIGDWEIAYRLLNIDDLEKAYSEIQEKAKNKGVKNVF